MATLRLLGIAARFAAGVVLGHDNVREACRAAREAFAGELPKADMAAVKAVAGDLARLSAAVREECPEVTDATVAEVAEALKETLPQVLEAPQDAGGAFASGLLARKAAGKVVLWLPTDVLGPCDTKEGKELAGFRGRFVVFSWVADGQGGHGFRIRDYLGRRWLYPTLAAGKSAPARPEWATVGVGIEKSAVDVWLSGRCDVPCLQKYGLYFSVETTPREELVPMLLLLTVAAGRDGPRG